MKKIIISFAVLLTMCSHIAMAQTPLTDTNLQFFYDFGNGRQFVTSTFEMFHPDSWGNTFFFVDIDYNFKNVSNKNIGPGGAYLEIARCLNFWSSTALKDLSLQVEYNGGRGAHGGGAFSGKDSSKVDRSAAYAARHIAKNIVAAGVCDEALVQIAYAIGVAQPVGFYVNTYGTAHVKDANGKKMGDAEIAEKLKTLFDLRPYAIVKRFGLKNPIFEATASYGHFGRDPFTEKVEVLYKDKDTFTENGKNYKNVEFFAWEKVDMVPEIQKVFSL